MKRVFCVLLVFCLMLISGCQKKSQYDEMVTDAIDELCDHWEDQYKDYEYEDGYLAIVNTTVIVLEKDAGEIHDMFEDMAYILEFDLRVNFYGSDDGYYENAGSYYNCIAVYKDGDMQVMDNPLRTYQVRTYQTDFSDLIAEVKDLGSDYDQVIDVFDR